MVDRSELSGARPGDGCWLANQPDQWNCLHSLQGGDQLQPRRPRDLLQTPHQGALRLLQPQPPAGPQSRPARLSEPGDQDDEDQAGAGADLLQQHLEL